MRKFRIKYNKAARTDLRELRKRIARTAPRGAREYVGKLKLEISRLSKLPLSGWVVEEFNVPDILEIVFDMYRVLYHYDGNRIVILRVWPGARPLGRRDLGIE